MLRCLRWLLQRKSMDMDLNLENVLNKQNIVYDLSILYRKRYTNDAKKNIIIE